LRAEMVQGLTLPTFTLMVWGSNRFNTSITALRALGSYIGVPRFVLAGIANGNQVHDSSRSMAPLCEVRMYWQRTSRHCRKEIKRARARESSEASRRSIQDEVWGWGDDAHSEYHPILLWKPVSANNNWLGSFLGRVRVYKKPSHLQMWSTSVAKATATRITYIHTYIHTYISKNHFALNFGKGNFGGKKFSLQNHLKLCLLIILNNFKA
jgi:hypothetical protein